MSLVALPAPTESNDDCTQGRMLAHSPRQRRVATWEKDEMVEIRTAQTERLVALLPEQPPLRQLRSAFPAHRVATDPEHDNLGRLCLRAGGGIVP